jgi:hypothetical protein
VAESAWFFQKNPAALELRARQEMLPLTDIAKGRMRCGVSKYMNNKEKADVAGDRQGLSLIDAQANGVS